MFNSFSLLMFSGFHPIGYRQDFNHAPVFISSPHLKPDTSLENSLGFANTTYSPNSFSLKSPLYPLLYGESWFTEDAFSVRQSMDDGGGSIDSIAGGSTDCKNANFSPKYNSQELDKESQFYYFNARHYDPELARFVSADTVIDGVNTTAGWNRYMYVKGNPIVYRDPTGHDARVASRPVIAGKDHAFVVITTDGPKTYGKQHEDKFQKYTDKEGKTTYAAVLSGQPDNFAESGDRLVNTTQNKRDRELIQQYFEGDIKGAAEDDLKFLSGVLQDKSRNTKAIDQKILDDYDKFLTGSVEYDAIPPTN